VVGIPGDEIDITENGYFTVNGSIPYETIYYVTKPVEGGPVNYPYKVQEGELFVLADMRDNGKDSRYFGAIPVDCYRGKAVLIVRRRGI
jgi:signal peptidase I